MKKTLLFFLLIFLIPTAIFAQAATKEDIESSLKEIEGLKTYIDLKIETINARIDANTKAVNARIDANGAKIDALNTKIDEVAKRLDGRIDGLDGKIDMVNDKVNYLFGFLGLLIPIIAIPPIADSIA